MPKDIIDTLYDHYKDTCSITGDAIRRRDRLMIFAIITLGSFALQSIFPNDSVGILNEFLNFKFGITLTLNLSVIGNMVWFLLLIFTVRYFQVAVFVERQHSYTHKVEDALNKELGGHTITREGKSYLSNYPRFSNWMWFLYTVAFPILLLIVAASKIISELKSVFSVGWSPSLIFDITVFILLTVSTILYLAKIHYKGNQEKS